MKVFVDNSSKLFEEVSYTWRIFAQNIGLDFVFVSEPGSADIQIGKEIKGRGCAEGNGTVGGNGSVGEKRSVGGNGSLGGSADIKDGEGERANTSDYYSARFEKNYLLGNWAFEKVLNDKGWVELEGGRIDWLLSAFYFLNSLQEYPQGGKLGSLDEVGRFQYKLSYQAHFNSALENKVQFCFDQLLLEIPQLSGFKKKIRPTRVFLTHDIDSIYGAFREDRNYWLKRFNPFMAAKVVLNELLGNPGWFTIDRIMKIEDEYDLKSTFFWLVNQGKVNERELNADYDLHSPMVWNALERLNYRGWENGIHKSISSDSLQLEMEKAKFQPAANRYHYLKFQLPGLYDSVEQAGLKLDASLGFAEQYGFRNSYALPFTPFNVKERRPYALVEAPLHIMDGTFQRYMNVSGVDAGKAMVDFFEAHAANAVISVLWHNSFCTDYKYGEFFKAYKTLLVYLYEKGIKSIGAAEIVKEFELTGN